MALFRTIFRKVVRFGIWEADRAFAQLSPLIRPREWGTRLYRVSRERDRRGPQLNQAEIGGRSSILCLRRLIFLTYPLGYRTKG